MARWTAVQIAEFVARKRAYGGALAALLFIVVEVLSRPPLLAGDPVRAAGRIDWWAVYAGLLLLLNGSGGGLLWQRRIRALVNDEVSLAHRRTAAVAGYWTVAVVSLAVYLTAQRLPLTGRGAAYLIVTPAAVVPLLVFAFLEHRSLRHG